MKKQKDIGDLYREKFSGYSPEPPADVWNNVQGKVNGKKSLWKKIVFPAAGLIVVGVAAYLLFANVQEDSSAILVTENNQKTITSNNTNLYQEEFSTKETPAHTIVSNTSSATNGQNNSIQNQENLIAQSKEEPNSINDNSLLINENQQTNTKKNTEEQAITTNRVSENLPEKVDRQEIQSKKYLPAIISKDTSICENTEAQLYIYNVKNIRWSTGETKNKILVNPSFDEKYSVSFTMDNGKDSMVSITIKVVECVELYVPNAFTPNGDGLNDVFTAKANMDLDYFEMNIYATAGKQLLFSSKNIKQSWDGTYRGQIQPHGIYFYTIRYKDSFGKIVEKSGELLLILQ